MSKLIDLTGQKFGMLTVVERTANNSYGSARWKCLCDCGEILIRESSTLKKGVDSSCGCLSSPDLTGQRFGKLIVIRKAGRNKNRQFLWQCKCDCGGEITVITSELNLGRTSSCSCSHKTRLKDITGQKFGKLTVVKRGISKDGQTRWHCLCDCGQETVVYSTSLMSGDTRSCGCGRFKDLSGKKYGKLVVVNKIIERKSKKGVLWNCLCECGKSIAVPSASLQKGQIKTCGCGRFQGPAIIIKTYEYKIWLNIKYKCQKPWHDEFWSHGAKGVQLCERWLSSPENFLADMGPRPSPNHFLTRINKDGDFSPENCIWKERKPRQSSKKTKQSKKN